MRESIPGSGEVQLSVEEVRALSAWHAGEQDTKQLLQILGLTGNSTRDNDYVEQEQILWGVNEDDFDFEEISSYLDEGRYLELQNGAAPTAEEVEKWKDELIMMNRFQFRYLWRVVHPEFKLEFTTDHGDGGYIDDYSSPTFI